MYNPWLFFVVRSLVASSTLILLCTAQPSQGCYADGQVTGTSVEGSATASPLLPNAIQPAVIRIRSGSTYTYTIKSVLSYWYGTRQSVDEVGISRTVEQRYPNNVYGKATNASVLPQDGYSQNGLPAGSGSATRTYGPYTPVNSYSVEYIYLNMIDTFGTFWLPEVTHNPIVTNSNPGYAIAVYVYPNTAQALFYDSTGAALNKETFQGTGPKGVQVKLSNLYPAGVTWVQFYQGTPSNPLSTVTTIPATQATAKSTDLDARNVNGLDLSSLIATLGNWTVEVIQRTGCYPDDHIGSATFTVVSNTNNNITSIKVNTGLGSLK
jgi:hypothetical protein